MMNAVLQVFNGLIFVLDRLFDLALDFFNQLRLEGGGLKNLMKLSFFLFKLFKFCLQLASEDYIMKLCVFLYFVSELVKLILQILSVKYNFFIFFT